MQYSIIMLVTGHFIYCLNNNGWSYTYIIITSILFACIILKIYNLYGNNKIKSLILNYYLNFKIDWVNIVLDRLSLFISFKSAWFILTQLITYLREYSGGACFICLDYIDTILHISLFTIIFGGSLLNIQKYILYYIHLLPVTLSNILFSYKEMFNFGGFPSDITNLLPQLEEDLVVSCLSIKLGFSRELIKSSFNLNNDNKKLFIDFFNLNVNEPILNTFYFNKNGSYLIPESNIKHAKPLYPDKPIHLFSQKGFNNISCAVDYIKSNYPSTKVLGLYDNQSNTLYTLTSKKNLINSNEFLFYCNGPIKQTFIPYDPSNKLRNNKGLYVKSLDGQYFPLKDCETMSPNIGGHRLTTESLFWVCHDPAKQIIGVTKLLNAQRLPEPLNTMEPAYSSGLRDNRFRRQ